MHIAIDDTYGPGNMHQSRYITGKRRTSVGIVFEDNAVEDIRHNIRDCLKFIKYELDIDANEFHFTEIFNRRGPWSKINDDTNIKILEAFSELYYQNQWKVHVQTIDKRTLSDHGIKAILAKFDSLDLSDSASFSLCFLLYKIKSIYSAENIPLVLHVDEGIGNACKEFGNIIFRDWPNDYKGYFESSREEPLLQLADFMAFSINRMTYLSIKDARTPFDLKVLRILGSMSINSPDLIRVELSKSFTVNDVDKIHDQDRKNKGLPQL